MNNGYKKIFWGFVFATFHINLGAIQIVPTFIGYIIIYLGIEKIAKDYNLKEGSVEILEISTMQN